MIFGRPGSGKSTFALQLGKHCNLPVHHLDRFFFCSGWQERDYQEFMAIQEQFVAEDRWIIDGNSIQSLETRYARADLVLYFKFSPFVCMWRLLKRFFRKDQTIQDRAPECPETITWKLLRYMWGFDARVAAQLKELQRKYPGVACHIITNNAELEAIKKQLKI
jgi:adenylate kinase family enzyme